MKIVSAEDIKRRTKMREETKKSKISSEKAKDTYLPAVSINEKNNRISSAKYARLPALEIEPSRCKPWFYHNRDLAWLTTEKCSDLISSISRNGQREPGMVRKIDQDKNPDPDHDFEIIYGVRRWYSVSQLHGKKFLAVVTEDSDMECMVHMHSENADSQDITEFERAYSFKIQFESGLFSGQRAMAKELGVSQSLVSRMINAASIFNYDFIRNLFPNKLDISVREAFNLYKLLEDKKTGLEIEKRAKNILSSKSKQNLSTRDIFAALKGASSSKKAQDTDVVLLSRKKENLITLKVNSSGNFLIKCSSKIGSIDTTDIKKILSQFVDDYVMPQSK